MTERQLRFIIHYLWISLLLCSSTGSSDCSDSIKSNSIRCLNEYLSSYSQTSQANCTAMKAMLCCVDKELDKCDYKRSTYAKPLKVRLPLDLNVCGIDRALAFETAQDRCDPTRGWRDLPPGFKVCNQAQSKAKFRMCSDIYATLRHMNATECVNITTYIDCMSEVVRLCEDMKTNTDWRVKMAQRYFCKATTEAQTTQETQNTAGQNPGPSVSSGGAAGRQRYRVVSKLVEPWLMKKSNISINSTRTDTYEGYVIDMLDAIAKEAKFDYDLHLVKDNLYGSKTGDKWTGMIGELVEGKADIAAALITVTINREEAVDFTIAFHTSQAYAIMQKRPQNQKPKIENINDLMSQDTVKVGTVMDGPVYDEVRMLRERNGTYKRLWTKFAKNPKHLKRDANEGIDKARGDNQYAFIVDGMTKDWVLSAPPCDLQALSTGIYQRKHAFAVTNHSPLRDQINKAVTDLYYDGTLDKFKRKWVGEDKCISSACAAGGSLCIILGLLFVWFMNNKP